MTPIRIAVCNGSWVVAAKVINIATAEIGATRSTSLISGSLPCDELESDDEDEPADDRHRDELGHRTGDQNEHRKPDAREDAGPTGLCPSGSRDAGARQRTTCGQRAEEATRQVGRCPARLKSPDMLLRLPSGFGTAAEIPAACASATSATATPPSRSSGITAKFGRVSGGREFAIEAMSPTVSTSMCAIATTAVTTTRAIRIAKDLSGLMKWNTAHTATVPPATATAVGFHRPICGQRVDELADRVAALRLIAGRIVEHTGDDLQRDAGAEARHDRVGDEVHDRPEAQQSEDQHHRADDDGRAPRRWRDRRGRGPSRLSTLRDDSAIALVSVVTIKTVREKTEATMPGTTPEYRPTTGLNPPMLA